MVIRFSTFEEAALAVAELRNKGHFAAISDEYASSFWGPATIGGVRVITSEEPVEDEQAPLEKSNFAELIMDILRVTTISLFSLFVVFLGFRILRFIVLNPIPAILLIATLAVIALIFLLVAATIALISDRLYRASVLRTKDTRSMRDLWLVAFTIVLCFAFFFV